MVQIVIVQSTQNVCLKAYKRQLCLKLSVRKYDSCLFQQFDVFELNNKFCVTNTKCVSKIAICSGLSFFIIKIKFMLFSFLIN